MTPKAQFRVRLAIDKRALESVLEHSSSLREQGVSCSALEIAIALSAERLASMQLGRLVVCVRQGAHHTDGIPLEVWRTALGDEIKLAPAVRALTQSFTLVNTREADLPDIVADRTAFLEEERSLLTAVRDAITTIAQHRQLGLRGAGTLAVPPDTHVAKQSFIKTLVSQPGELFSRVSALLKPQAFLLVCATLPSAITHLVSGSASGLYFNGYCIKTSGRGEPLRKFL